MKKFKEIIFFLTFTTQSHLFLDKKDSRKQTELDIKAIAHQWRGTPPTAEASNQAPVQAISTATSLSKGTDKQTSLLTDWSSQPTLLCRSNRTCSFLFFFSLYEVLRSARIFVFFAEDGDLGLVRFCTSTLAVSVTTVTTSVPPVAVGGSTVSVSVSRSWDEGVRMLVYS